jgi:hypothetical protein
MNHYGEQALLHWRLYLPASYSRLEDPDRFFTDLGEQAEAEIEDRYLGYAGPEIPGESTEDKQQRLDRAMSRASEEVYAELVTPSPASQGEPPAPPEISPAS